MPVTVLSSSQADDAVTVLCEAFRDYPVMRHVLGPNAGYAQRLRTLIGFFVAARIHRRDLILGVFEGGRLEAVALVTLPGTDPGPEALSVLREAVWSELGSEARARYDRFGAASHQFDIQAVHHHLNMIGVRPSHLGQGLARILLDHVHGLADADQGSAGVTLSTETAANVELYEHFGYRRLGYTRVADDLETWVFFRPRTAGAAT
jgi:GNAT superfamily N-acetyltransferase